MQSETRKPRVFVDEDATFSGEPLVRIIEGAGCEAIRAADGKDLTDALDAVAPPLDLVVLALEPDRVGRLHAIAELRKRDWLAAIPIVGVCAWSAELDLWQLRALGVIGLIDTRARAEHVRFRVGQIVYKGREGRRHERAPCYIPVAMDLAEGSLSGHAITLSVGGMGVVCSRYIEPNTPVRLRFRPDDESCEIEVAGRTVHVREARRGGGEYEVGVFFQRLSKPAHASLFTAVTRLLAAWETQGAIALVEEPQPRPVTRPKR